MRVTLFTNEYPPNIYGGAGVHVDYLSKYLAELVEVEVRTFGKQNDEQSANPRAMGFPGWELLRQGKMPFAKVLQAISVNLAFNNRPLTADLVHCHTWYTFFAGFLAKLLYGAPLVVTMHSLEPLRPWKEEQLGSGYHLSSWIEKNGVEYADRVIAVSAEMKEDIVKTYQIPSEKVEVVHNGVDLDQYHPVRNRDYLDEQGIDHPYLLFVGRISRQKGILQLLKAMEQLDRVYLVLCAGSPDTPELEREVREEVNRNPRIKWIKQMIPKDKVIQLYSHAAAFVCPSIYEPFGIINLEAMACKAPVIASRVGGIKEVVVDGETGFLVAPDDPNELADRIKFALDNPELMAKFKENGRQRVEQYFSWRTIAKRTVELYRQVSQEPVLAK